MSGLKPAANVVGQVGAYLDRVQASIERLIRPEVRWLSAYHVPDPGGLVKLDAMENPYPWPGELADVWLETLRDLTVNRYPDPTATRLKARLRQAMGVPGGVEVLLGNGSDVLIQLVLLALAGEGRKVLAPEPTFVTYRLLALAVGMEYVGVPLETGGFSLDMPAKMVCCLTFSSIRITTSPPR